MSVRALKALTTIAATTLVLTLAGSAPAQPSQTEPIRKAPVIRVVAADTKASKQERAQLHQAAVQIGTLRNLAWACEDDLIQTGILDHRTRAAVDIWSLPQSIAYRTKFVAKHWANIAKGCQQTRKLHSNDAMIDRLNRGLAGTPMAGTGRELEAAGRRYHIHPAFIAAIAGTESSFGAAMCGNYNAYGLANCRGIWGVPTFRSWGDSYMFMAAFLTGHTSVSSGWPKARTTYDYNGYAACSSCWGAKTEMYMRTRFGVSSSVRYP